MASDVTLQPALPPVAPSRSSVPAGPAARNDFRAYEGGPRQAAGTTRSLPGEAPPERDLERLVEELSDLVQSVRRELKFSVDEESGRTVIRVIDSDTGETIRQIPPEEVLTLLGRFRDQQASLIREQA
jgi:flagellar protein FlaG